MTFKQALFGYSHYVNLLIALLSGVLFTMALGIFWDEGQELSKITKKTGLFTSLLSFLMSALFSFSVLYVCPIFETNKGYKIVIVEFFCYVSLFVAFLFSKWGILVYLDTSYLFSLPESRLAMLNVNDNFIEHKHFWDLILACCVLLCGLWLFMAVYTVFKVGELERRTKAQSRMHLHSELFV